MPTPTAQVNFKTARMIFVDGVLMPEQVGNVAQSPFDPSRCRLALPKVLLDKIKDPSEEQIRKGLEGNFCRCTGYTKIFESVREAAQKMKE